MSDAENNNNPIPESVNPNKKSADEIAGNIQDGYAEIKIAEDGLTANAEFHPPIGKGHPLDPDYIEKLLESDGITTGIKWDVIKDSIFECNTEHRILTEIIIAEGIKPIKEIPGYIRMEEKFFTEKKQLDQDSLQIDYRSLTPYLIAKKKEKLGHLVARRDGTPGKSVTGVEIPFVKKNIIQFKPGDNTRVEQDQVIALCDGRFILSEDKFWIEEVLQIAGGVDYHTGHIQFPGDVVLNGEIQDGFFVFSGGSIISKVTLDASEVIAKKSLICDLGIIGKKKGLIRVGGDIKAKFIDNCTVESRGSLIIEDSIHTSDVLTLNRVEMGDNGRIIAGSVKARVALEALKEERTIQELARKYEVHPRESDKIAAELFRNLASKENLNGVRLHSDNGHPMKGATMIMMLYWLGIIPSFSRPRVSDDNAYSESLFKTLKYTAGFPKFFSGLEHARSWMADFVNWYNDKHRHSGIGYITPKQRHSGEGKIIMKKRNAALLKAFSSKPERWSRKPALWDETETVYLNLSKEPREAS